MNFPTDPKSFAEAATRIRIGCSIVQQGIAEVCRDRPDLEQQLRAAVGVIMKSVNEAQELDNPPVDPEMPALRNEETGGNSENKDGVTRKPKQEQLGHDGQGNASLATLSTSATSSNVNLVAFPKKAELQKSYYNIPQPIDPSTVELFTDVSTDSEDEEASPSAILVPTTPNGPGRQKNDSSKKPAQKRPAPRQWRESSEERDSDEEEVTSDYEEEVVRQKIRRARKAQNPKREREIVRRRRFKDKKAVVQCDPLVEHSQEWRDKFVEALEYHRTCRLYDDPVFSSIDLLQLFRPPISGKPNGELPQNVLHEIKTAKVLFLNWRKNMDTQKATTQASRATKMPAQDLFEEFLMDADSNPPVAQDQSSEVSEAPAASPTSQIRDINQRWTGKPLPSISVFFSSEKSRNTMMGPPKSVYNASKYSTQEFPHSMSSTTSGFGESSLFQEPVVQYWDGFGDSDFSYQLDNVRSVRAFQVSDDVTSVSPGSGSSNDNLSLLDPTPMSTEQEFPANQTLFSANTPIYKESLISNSSDPEPIYSKGPHPVNSPIQEPEQPLEVKRPKKRCLTPIYSLILGPTPDVQNMTELVSYRSFRTKYHAHMKIAPPVKLGTLEYDQRYKEACERAANSPVYQDKKIVCLSCLFDLTSSKPIPQEVVNPVDAAMCYKLWRVDNYSSMWCASK
ncbi:hypothetical protein B9Z55_007390 [Caenorhabditis nigoni]|uniref:Uncharacterized protein n=1 Tax=Caenorhabditis nigoni TaxID=1611254 RepID=A0A2G5V9S6_9PELO|nr:hypothetical protein B9Z55_007390 [Caenorhabditis nigoni]